MPPAPASSQRGAPSRLPASPRSRRTASQEAAPPRSWIFQARRDRFDIPGALENHDTDEWPVRQHRTAIRPHDRVYFWLAGRDAGIYGAGHILTAPQLSTSTLPSTWYTTVGVRSGLAGAPPAA